MTATPTTSDVDETGSDDAVLVEHHHADDTTPPPLVMECPNTTTTGSSGTADGSGAAAKTKGRTVTPVPTKNESSSGKDVSTTKDDAPSALNIVSIGSEDDAYAFTYHQEQFDQILSRIPSGYKVAVVSVVGAFRTGKSFLLTWFLRYLHAIQQVNYDGEDEETPWYETVSTVGNDGFHWKAGSERNTTGIWMWSHPHLRHRQKLAILLVDTQGMFDHETTMNLTASIFGFSTLLSSYLIYNVDKRIQEDNLQQLALFSEYAKSAVAQDKEADGTPKPFQKIEFLVRDWQHFDDVLDEHQHANAEDTSNYSAMEKMMGNYLETVIADRAAKDLKETREQIIGCFEKISCYGLCHPGFAVTKKKYTGTVNDMERQFLHLLDRFCKKVFDKVEPKKIHGREITAPELGTYVAAYAQLFRSGAKFPTAATLLEATTTANNNNAIFLAIASYQGEMDRVAGPNCSSYVRASDLEEENRRHFQKSLEVFASVANFGSKRQIDASREQLVNQLNEKYNTYRSLNEGRDPLAGLET